MKEKGGLNLTKKMKTAIIGAFAGFCAVILGVSIGLMAWSGLKTRKLLKESISSQLISISMAASEVINDNMAYFLTLDDYTDYFKDEIKTIITADPDAYEFDADDFSDEYKAFLTALREIKNTAGATYIYALREFNDDYRFIIDTDEEDQNPFEVYEVEEGDVFIDAFAGKNSFVFGLVDEYGDWNSGAVPIYNNGQVVAIICTDIEDTAFTGSVKQFNLSLILISVILTIILAIFFVMLVFLLNHIQRIQSQLSKMANYDKLTELPNRRFLLEQLDELTTKKEKMPFALYFIDMDNFKKVNDSAGHDAGDALLQHVAMYLQSAQKNSSVYRPGAGSLTVAARVGGDEFILIAPYVSTEEDASKFAQDLLDGFRQTHIDKYIDKYDVGLSIGVALYPEHTENFHVLIKYADIAMYNAKRAGKNQFKIYYDEMEAKDEK